MYENPEIPENQPTRPAKRVRTGSRTLVACINCKERKLKCDNKPLGCDNCLRLSSMCLVEDPVTKRHQPRNYLETLEQRVAFLEDILKCHHPDLADDHLFSGDLHQTHVRSSPASYDGQWDIAEASNERNGLDDLASNVGLLSLNAAGAEPHYLGSSSTFAFSRLINLSLRQVVLKAPKTCGSSGPSKYEPSMLPSPCALPDHDIGIRLSNAYFQNIHFQYPFLHEPTFREWEAAVAKRPSPFDDLTPDPVALFFVNMVYAVGALLLPNLGCSAEKLYISAHVYLDHVLFYENLESIQAILCCAVYSVRSSIGTSHWKLAGLALRQCIDLGYHRSLTRLESTTDPLRQDLRKRVFWCTYSMECQAAVMLGRSLGLPLQGIDAEYPLDIDDSCITASGICGTPRSLFSDPPTNMTKAIHTFRIRRLLGSIHTSLYSDITRSNPGQEAHRAQIERLRAEIENWRALIPATLSHTGQMLSLFASSHWFDFEYDYAILQLYRAQIVDGRGGSSDAIFIDCLRAAEDICHGYRRQFLGKPTNYTWAAVHELCLAGLTYLHCLWTSPTVRGANSQSQVCSTCTDCTIVLVLMAERWDAAAPFRDIFEALAGRTMAMMDDKAQGKWTVSSASTLGDDTSQWRMSIADNGMSEGLHELLSSFMQES
ncbi:hypothetical protein BU16DRAFT_531570 [Lophium mytilinum]|uniref:Zn(2)-C6 fungal-type domain-containing protein n=1 Tax=Lophium mytilinum TaxID=390894 RepID=A0A6A6QB60_9PEZI|nr:hypothetical protein BU16DRAFT_531570 [Lophium mytilinum]